MRKLFFIVFVLFTYSALSAALPSENSSLNYTLVGFSAPCKGVCKLQVAVGRYNSVDSFEKNISITIEAKDGKVITEVPYFGALYTWRFTEGKKGTKNTPADLHHFSTRPYILDTVEVKMRIINDTGRYKGYYFFADITRTLYNMRGKPVWFLPQEDVPPSTLPTELRDLKTTPLGTISYLAKDILREVGYNGNILIDSRGSGAVSGDSIEHFHHEVYFLPNGHYIIPGTERVMLDLPSYKPDNATPADPAIIKANDGTYKEAIDFETVIEYDKDNKVVWSWKSSGYFIKSDLFTHYLPNGEFPVQDVHGNAIFFDQKNKVVYLGFREISRIIKIKYPEGNVLAVYGSEYDSKLPDLCNDLFCGQHRIGDAGDGNIYIFNNNSVTPDAMPKVEILKEVSGKKNSLQKIWEYDCTLQGISDNELGTFNRLNAQYEADRRASKAPNAIGIIAGGNVEKMPDGNYFISMSGQFAKLLIVDKNKNVLWSAVPERRLFANHYTFMSTYRASIVSPAELEKMIWGQK